MQKKITAFLTLAILLLNLFTLSAFAGTAPCVSVGTASGQAGDTVEIPVVLSDNTGFASLGIEIRYDAAALALTNVVASATGATFTRAQTFTANPFNMGWDSASNVTYNGTLATLTFEILTPTSGTYPITVEYYKGRNGNYIDGNSINYDEDFAPLHLTYAGGSVTVSGSGASGSYTFADAAFTYDGAAKTMPGVVYTVDGVAQPALPAGVTVTYSLDGETYTDALSVTEGGIYTIYAKIEEVGQAAQLLSATLTVGYLVGDVNSDNAVNLLDAGKITQKFAMWSVPFTATQEKAGARVMTPYDALTTADVVAMLQYIAGWPGITFGEMD